MRGKKTMTMGTLMKMVSRIPAKTVVGALQERGSRGLLLEMFDEIGKSMTEQERKASMFLTERKPVPVEVPLPPNVMTKIEEKKMERNLKKQRTRKRVDHTSKTLISSGHLSIGDRVKYGKKYTGVIISLRQVFCEIEWDPESVAVAAKSSQVIHRWPRASRLEKICLVK